MTDYVISEEQLSAITIVLKHSGVPTERNVLLTEIRSRPLSDELKKEWERIYKILESKCVEYKGVPVIHYSVIEDIFLRGEP